jgi:dTDP-4-dehydrorhamnose 3,5-epimerase
MQIERLKLADLLLIAPNKHADRRGFFSETYRGDVLASAGVRSEFVQDNHVYSAERGVLRGLHFQIPPRAQGQLVRCTRGAILDVAVDIRKGSPTFGHHVAVELSAENWKQLWVPPGFAHGYLALSEEIDFLYKCTDFYAPEHERAIRWDDAQLGVQWPLPANVTPLVSDKDARAPSFRDADTYP